MKRILIYKKAQIGETLTWVVATILILVILLIFIFISLTLSKSKEISLNKPSAEELRPSSELGEVGSKNSIAFSLKNENEESIKEWLNENEEVVIVSSNELVEFGGGAFVGKNVGGEYT